LLHPEALDRVPFVGTQYKELLDERVAEVYADTATTVDPDISVLIRTRNHADRIVDLFEDIDRQDFAGAVQVIVADTESVDGTADIARHYGASVVPLAQRTFNYAHSLNAGFKAADHPFVMTLVGHSRLTSDQTFRAVSRWAGDPELGGAYGAALPDLQASIGDLAISFLQRNTKRLAPAEKLENWQHGAMVAHRAVVSKAAWDELGKYDEEFGNGGEDTEFGKRMLASGMSIVREPALSVHHSYGLGLLDTVHRISTLRKARAGTTAPFDQTSVRHLAQPLR
jgi:glycosyltransferase involved in cell wall biosynthesis